MAALAGRRKAHDPVLLQVGDLTSYTDYLLILSGRSTRQVAALAEHLATGSKRAGVPPLGREGERDAQWILLDYGEVVVHIFYEPLRRHYDLEGLFVEADRIDIGHLGFGGDLDSAPELTRGETT
ncbi:MAG: ribosome silencing factor [Gammaproteobacteria bacterium]|nr:ribosome silencing factor [Pseudomonadota bacterium]MBU1656463.1 ribosome silencing factor [Gammaproteobacteria bacterium]